MNQLSVADATHLVKCEGGSLSPGRALFRLIAVLVVAGLVARAIVHGDVGVGHLFLPLVAEYLVLLLFLPLLTLILHDPDLRRDARRGLFLLAIFATVAAVWIGFQAMEEGVAWRVQAVVELRRLLGWVIGREMHWPVLAAAASMALSLPGRVAAFHRHGPPFLAVGTGCAIRFLVVLAACLLLPFVTRSAAHMVWTLWTVLLMAELGALWMHWDLQRRLRRRGIEV